MGGVETIPWWVAALIAPFAAWFGAQAWPVIVKAWERRDTAETAEEEDERERKRKLEERQVQADEKMAEALAAIGRTQVTIDFRLALIERHLSLDTEPQAQARARVEAPKSRARGATEGERGE